MNLRKRHLIYFTLFFAICTKKEKEKKKKKEQLYLIFANAIITIYNNIYSF